MVERRIGDGHEGFGDSRDDVGDDGSLDDEAQANRDQQFSEGVGGLI